MSWKNTFPLLFGVVGFLAMSALDPLWGMSDSNTDDDSQRSNVDYSQSRSQKKKFELQNGVKMKVLPGYYLCIF